MSIWDKLKKVFGPGELPFHEISTTEYERCVVGSLKDRLSISDMKKQIGGFVITHEGIEYPTDLLNLVRNGNIQSLRRIGQMLEDEMRQTPDIALVPDVRSSLGNVVTMHVEVSMPAAEVAEIRNVIYPPDIANQRPSTPFSILGESNQSHTGFQGPSSFIDPANPIYGPGSGLTS